MSIVTKTGDKGETGLYGGQRISKGDLRMHTIGAVDELNALLGIIISETSQARMPALVVIQNILFRLGADLATPRENNKAQVPRIEPTHIAEIEGWIADLENSTEMPQYFVLPGGSKTAAQLHLARTVCRRSERFAVELAQKQDIGPHIVIYLNRLSDYLFLAALRANKEAGVADVRVQY